jgi:hypothetical protein
MIRFLLFLVQIQWRDRIATSGFLIGITIQNLLLSFSLWSISSSQDEALLLCTRGTLMSAIGIALFSAMASIQNEFRYGTAESVLLSKISFFPLIGLRAFFTAIISTPAILLPFGVIAFRFPGILNAHWAVMVIGVHCTVTIVGFQASFILNARDVPYMTLPWLRSGLLILGLSLLPLSFAENASLLLPIGWCVRLAKNQTDWGMDLLGLIMNSIVTSTLLFFFLGNRVRNRIERSLVDGRASG